MAPQQPQTASRSLASKAEGSQAKSQSQGQMSVGREEDRVSSPGTKKSGSMTAIERQKRRNA